MRLTVDHVLEQSQWDFFWAPPDATVVNRPELLYIRCPRDVPHLNMVTRLRASPDGLPALVDEVVQAHAGRRSRWSVLSLQDNADLEARLGRAGYEPGPAHQVYAVHPDRYVPRPTGGIVVERVDSLRRLRHSAHVTREAFGRAEASVTDSAQQERDLATCTGPNARVIQFVAYDRASGQPVSSGGLNLYPALHFGFLWGGGTVPEARGRGAYSAVVASRLAFAKQAGLDQVGLYARLDTSAPIVAKQGFQGHGRMVFWERSAGP